MSALRSRDPIDDADQYCFTSAKNNRVRCKVPIDARPKREANLVAHTADLDDQSDITDALDALRAAQLKAQAGGRSIVILKGRRLVRVDPTGEYVIRILADRPRVTVRTKRSIP